MPDKSATEEQPGQPLPARGIPAVSVTEVAPTAVPPTNGPAPEPTPHNLQDVLPEITKLAQRVGGLDKLAELIQTLRGVRT
jgi:hypothetical protein